MLYIVRIPRKLSNKQRICSVRQVEPPLQPCHLGCLESPVLRCWSALGSWRGQAGDDISLRARDAVHCWEWTLTPAVPIANSKILLAAMLNVGKRAWLSGLVARFWRFSIVDRSPSSQRRICHSYFSSAEERLKILATSAKLTFFFFFWLALQDEMQFGNLSNIIWKSCLDVSHYELHLLLAGVLKDALCGNF